LHPLDLIHQLMSFVTIHVKLVKPEQLIFVLLVLKIEKIHMNAHVLKDIMRQKDLKTVPHVKSNVNLAQILPIIVMNVLETELTHLIVIAQAPQLMMLVKQFAQTAQMNVKHVNLMENVLLVELTESYPTVFVMIIIMKQSFSEKEFVKFVT